MKPNFNAGKMENGKKGFGWVVRDCEGSVCVMGLTQAKWFRGAEIEEAEACYNGV